MKTIIYVMIYAGLALMIFNIISYIRFARKIKSAGNWETERRILNVPIILLVLFAIGYALVGILGEPDLIISGILFGGSIFVCVIEWLYNRIVGRIRQNERLEAELTSAKESSEAKTFFLSNMSHDIRTPLNAVLGYTALARAEGTDPAKKDEYLDKIENAGKQLLEIVDDVLEMSRIESGRFELEPAVTDLQQVVQEAADVLSEKKKKKKIGFRSRCCVTDRYVLCDRKRLNRAVMNMLSNAYKFTPEGGAILFGIRETADEGEIAFYELHVRDTGIGMSPEFAQKLFDPFEREKTSTVSRTQGTGLGMAITKSIIDMMNGTIEVKTKQGEGTEFIVSFAFPKAEPPEEKEKESDTGCREFGGSRILLVEDNQVNQEIACMLLEQAGYTVDTAGNGQIAVDRIRNADPGYYRLVLMDIQMPVLDGYEAAKAIRSLDDELRSRIPIIAMTANAFKEDEERAKEAGMQAHITKPLNTEKMFETIQEVLKG